MSPQRIPLKINFLKRTENKMDFCFQSRRSNRYQIYHPISNISKARQNIWNNSTQDTDIRQWRKAIPKKWGKKKKKLSPILPQQLPKKISRPQHRKRKSRQTGSLPELKRYSWALAGVAQWLCQVSRRGRTKGNHTLMFLSLSFSLPLCLKIKKEIKSFKKTLSNKHT